MSDSPWMQLAIVTARRGMARGQSPFGAVIVRGDELVVAAHNLVLESTDITAHAEVTAIRGACAKLRQLHLRGCTIYSTCEPCPMCFAAIHWADIDRIVYGASIADAAGAGFNELHVSNQQMKQIGRSRVEIVAGVMQAQCAALFSEWADRPDRKAY